MQRHHCSQSGISGRHGTRGWSRERLSCQHYDQALGFLEIHSTIQYSSFLFIRNSLTTKLSPDSSSATYDHPIAAILLVSNLGFQSSDVPTWKGKVFCPESYEPNTADARLWIKEWRSFRISLVESSQCFLYIASPFVMLTQWTKSPCIPIPASSSFWIGSNTLRKTSIPFSQMNRSMPFVSTFCTCCEAVVYTI